MELFEYIVKLLVCMLECYLIYDFFNNISNVRHKFTKKNVIMICAVTVLIHFVINLANNAMVNLVSFIIIYFCFTIILFSIDMKIRIFCFLITFSLNIASEYCYVILIELSTNKIMKQNVPLITDNLIQAIYMIVLRYILYTLVKYIVSKKDRMMPTNIFLMYMCLPVASLFMMMTMLYLGVNFEENPHQKVMIIIAVMCMLFVNILVFNAFNKHAEQIYENCGMDMTSLKNNNKQTDTEDVLSDDEKYDELMHNMSNYIRVLERLIQCGENEKAGLPFFTLEAVMDRLNTKFWYSSLQKMDDENYEQFIETMVRRVDVPVKAVLGKSIITVNDFVNIQVGDIIRLDTKVDDELDVYVGNIKKFTAVPGASKEAYAVRVTSVNREEE